MIRQNKMINWKKIIWLMILLLVVFMQGVIGITTVGSIGAGTIETFTLGSSEVTACALEKWKCESDSCCVTEVDSGNVCYGVCVLNEEFSNTPTEGTYNSLSEVKTETTTPLPASLTPTCTSLKCREIDEVWQILTSKTITSLSGKVWSGSAWIPFGIAYPVKPLTSGEGSTATTGTSGPTGEVTPAPDGTGTTTGGVGTSNLIAQVALQEEERWRTGRWTESSQEGLYYITNRYWPATGYSRRYSSSFAWSAAFISYVIKNAGYTEFPGATYHLTYFDNVKKNEYPICQTYPKSQINQIKVGDIICQCRDTSCPLDYNNLPTTGPSHCDIVVGKNTDGSLQVIGGNLDNKVLKQNNYNKNNPNIFGFISCSGEPIVTSGTVASTSTDVTQMASTIAGLSWQSIAGSTSSWSSTQHLSTIIEESQKQSLDPCFALVTVLHESRGDANAVGNDANVPGCNVIARRKLLMEESSNCQDQYNSESALRQDCLDNKDNSYANYPRPLENVNDCLDDFLNVGKYKLNIPSNPSERQNFFCNNEADLNYRYGIGLGQITPPEDLGYYTIGSKPYSHCDLFDPQTNAEATVALLKEKGATTATAKDPITLVFSKYVGGTNNPEGPRRFAHYFQCKSALQEYVS